MTKYVLKRIGYAIFTVFLISVITFTLMNMIPGGPFLSEKAVSPATKAAMEKKYGLDKPKHIQFINYMGSMLQGDLGFSIKQKGRTANEIISSTFPVSARVGGLAILIAVIIGLTLGSIAAVNRGTWVDSLIMIISTVGNALPAFVIGTFFMYGFGVAMKILPTMGLSSPKHYIMPVATLAFYPMAYITRLTRTNMLDALGQDYMRTARAKGVSRVSMIFKHAMRNAISPVITYLGPLIAYTLAGSFVVEKIFNVPGLGREFINCITGRDYPMVMSTTIFLAAFMVCMNVVVDISYHIVDPRVKLK